MIIIIVVDNNNSFEVFKFSIVVLPSNQFFVVDNWVDAETVPVNKHLFIVLKNCKEAHYRGVEIGKIIIWIKNCINIVLSRTALSLLFYILTP